MVQEALTNVHHHSASKMARIRMVRDDGGLRVEDEGRGMTAARRNKSPGPHPPSAWAWRAFESG
jgi:signal transduction histidine kinase